MPLPVELLHFKEKQPIDSELEKLSLYILSFLPQYFVFPSDSQMRQLKDPKTVTTDKQP